MRIMDRVCEREVGKSLVMSREGVKPPTHLENQVLSTQGTISILGIASFHLIAFEFEKKLTN